MINPQETEDFVTGFLWSMRVLEFCPKEYVCFRKANNMHKALIEMDSLFKYKKLPALINMVEMLILAFKVSIPDC